MPASPEKPSSALQTGVIMDPISGIAVYKDSTFAMLLEAQRRGHDIWYMEPADLTVRDGAAWGAMRRLRVRLCLRRRRPSPQATRPTNSF